jgi:hypothetical protein
LYDARPDFEPGKHEIVCRLVDIPLRPANYALRLGFLDQYRHTLWYAENIRPLGVIPGRYDITKIPEAGLVDVPAEWHFNPIAPAAELHPSQGVLEPVPAAGVGQRM